MKKLISIPVIALLLVACGGKQDKGSLTEELNNSWLEMTSEEQATFCLGYTIVPEEEFRTQAAEKFGKADADEAVAWAKEICG